MCVTVLPACMRVHHIRSVPVEIRSLRFPETGVTAPCGCWELNLDPLQEWQMFLTNEPTLNQLFSSPAPKIDFNFFR